MKTLEANSIRAGRTDGEMAGMNILQKVRANRWVWESVSSRIDII